jgi:xanthine dehydrogenase accessory factor
VIYALLAEAAANARPSVLLTVVMLRGSAPCGLGAKMLLNATSVVGTIGGGNLEMQALREAKAMLAALEAGQQVLPKTLVAVLGTNTGEFAVQCCGGEVTVLLEPLGMRPQVAIFGAGHVGSALARVLSRLPLDLWLLDSRQSVLVAQPPAALAPVAHLRCIHAPFPEVEMQNLAPGALVYILTHDHSEDLALVAAALTRSDLGFIGLIGSKTKWLHFQQQLRQAGFGATDLARITTPIGLESIVSKDPEIIAIAVAAQVLQCLGW